MLQINSYQFKRTVTIDRITCFSLWIIRWKMKHNRNIMKRQNKLKVWTSWRHQNRLYHVIITVDRIAVFFSLWTLPAHLNALDMPATVVATISWGSNDHFEKNLGEEVVPSKTMGWQFYQNLKAMDSSFYRRRRPCIFPMYTYTALQAQCPLAQFYTGRSTCYYLILFLFSFIDRRLNRNLHVQWNCNVHYKFDFALWSCGGRTCMLNQKKLLKHFDLRLCVW